MADYQKYCIIKLALSFLGVGLLFLMLATDQLSLILALVLVLPLPAESMLYKYKGNTALKNRNSKFSILLPLLLFVLLIGDCIVRGKYDHALLFFVACWYLLEVLLPKGLIIPQPFRNRLMDEREEKLHNESKKFAYIIFWIGTLVAFLFLHTSGLTLLPVRYVVLYPAAGYLLICLSQSVTGLILFKRGLPNE